MEQDKHLLAAAHQALADHRQLASLESLLALVRRSPSAVRALDIFLSGEPRRYERAARLVQDSIRAVDAWEARRANSPRRSLTVQNP